MKKMKEEKEKEKREAKNIREVSHALAEMEVIDVICGPKFMKNSRWFQSLASRNMYLIMYCTVGLVIGMFFTYSVSTISTLEKRFKLTSKLTGIMLAGNDISQVLLAILVAYYGNYGNRPKWLGFGILSASFSCLLSAMPHYIYGPGQDAIDVAENSLRGGQTLGGGSNSSWASSPEGLNNTGVCYSPYDPDCSAEGIDFNSTTLGPIIILFIAEFFVGIAVAIFYSIGLVYLDDNINKKDAPVYYAISMMIRVVGPVLGFFMGSKCLSIYIDPSYEPNISLRDPRWLGAWWLGFLILTGLLGLCGLMLLFFPRTLPITMYKLMQKEQKKLNPDSNGEITKESNLEHLLELVKISQRRVKPTLKELPNALKRLIKNKIWLGYEFNIVFDLFALMGYWSFKPKYLEYQFRMSASVATFYTGVAGLVSSVVGLAISGLIIAKFKPRPRVIAGYSCVLTIFSAIAMFSLAFIRCPQLDVVGPDYQCNATTIPGCNLDCGCTDRYSPVCSEDNITTFYSPCYAGCTKINSSAFPVEYYDCKCIAPLNAAMMHNTSEVDKEYGKVVQGYCPENCDSFFYYIITTIVSKAISSTGKIGGTLIYLRSVAEHDKGLALGTSTVLISLFAFIPAPIVMGAIVDSACVIWDNTCGTKGNCWLYDSDRFRLLVHLVPAGILCFAVLGDLVVFFNCKHLQLYEEKEEDIICNENELSLLKDNDMPNETSNYQNNQNGTKEITQLS